MSRCILLYSDLVLALAIIFLKFAICFRISPVEKMTPYLHSRWPIGRNFNPFKPSSYWHFDETINKFKSISRSSNTLRNQRDDTIYALSSGPMTKCGVSVIRLSGSLSKYCLERLLQRPSKDGKGEESPLLAPPTTKFPAPRSATLRKLYCPRTGDVLDKALVLWFPGPRSFTGNDVVEFHVHGSRAVVSGLFHAFEFLDDELKSSRQLSDPKDEYLGGVRPADRGEFTRNAFANGKMDLTEVEGLSDLLEADTSEQRKQALRQMDGHMRVIFESWREKLVKALAHTEAVIDFGDDDRESDINDDAMWALLPSIQALREEISRHLLDGKKGELVREGIKIALAGPPNAGKSSLLNALARRPAAIVSPIAGTTRDIVEVRMDLAGISCIISDTAGLRASTSDPIEMEGIKRARSAFQSAQLKVFVGDCSSMESIGEASNLLVDLLQQQRLIASPAREVKAMGNGEVEEEGDEEDDTADNGDDDDSASLDPFKVLFVLNKADLLNNNDTNAASVKEIEQRYQHQLGPQSALASAAAEKFLISCATGAGIADLEHALSSSIHSLFSDHRSGETVLITRERHRRHLKQCLGHLDAFLGCSRGRLPMDLAAEELRLAMMELGKVTGRVDVEELLDVIFRDFCIGK